MKMRLIRHATLDMEYGGMRILVDPMLSEAEANPPIAGTPNERRNPLVPLPMPALELAREPWDLALVTHLHQDHWDTAAAGLLRKDLPILCQPGDAAVLLEQGFRDVAEVEGKPCKGRVEIHRTGGRHGTGDIGRRMGRVSGFVLRAEGEPRVYIAGDTILCGEVEEALRTYRPDWAVVNAGGARFLTGAPITMTPDDVAGVCRIAPETKVAAVHMEAINHCIVTRAELRDAMEGQGLGYRVFIPSDGESIPC